MSLKCKSVITKQAIETFYGCHIDEIKYKEDYIYVRFLRNGNGPAPEYHVDDFSFKGINTFELVDCSLDWSSYLVKIMDRNQAIEYIKQANEVFEQQKLNSTL